MTAAAAGAQPPGWAGPGPAVLRPMEPGDIDVITALDAQLFGVDCWPRYMFEDELAQPDTRRYIVAEVPDDVGHLHLAGYAGLMCVEPVGDIQTIGVLPEFEGRGIARAMMADLIAEAVRRGAKEIMLEVSTANPRAQDLYKRYGFEHIHTRRKYYRDGSDGLIMRLSLPTPTDVKDPS